MERLDLPTYEIEVQCWFNGLIKLGGSCATKFDKSTKGTVFRFRQKDVSFFAAG
jgi:hypothetical protein